MKRNKALLMLLICVSLVLMGCDRRLDIRDIITDASEGEGDNKAASGNADKEDLELPDITEYTLKKQADEDRHIMQNNPTFEDCVISVGSTAYSLPFSYKRISDEWTFNLSDYGFDENFMLGPNERTTDTIILSKENSNYNIVIGLYNPYDVKCTIEEAYVYSLTIDIRETGADYPIMRLPGELSWGATFSDIIAVAHPNQGFDVDEETGEMTLYYVYDYENYLILTVSKTRGISAVTIKTYKENRDIDKQENTEEQGN